MHRLGELIAFAALALWCDAALAEPLNGVLYKDQSCQCCEGHAKYLRENGFNLDVKPVPNLAELSEQAGVPAKFQGCHMITIDGYVFEGHITSEIIRRFLAEKPSGLTGLTLPGMPTGVPGMGGPKTGTYEVYAVKKDGTTTFYAAQ